MIVMLVLQIGGTSGTAATDSSGFSEYQLKAGYIYNFVSYTEWPESLPPEVALCVYGNGPLVGEILRLSDKPIGTSRIVTRKIVSTDAASGCHVVYVAPEVIGNLTRLLEVISKRPVLIVTDYPGASAAGAAINMLTEQGKVGFEVNLRAAKEQNLSLSYRLLRLAREVFN